MSNDAAIIDFASGRDKHLAPEALFISALIDSGQYTPATYGVRDNHIRNTRQIHEFCLRYQAEAKRSPDIGLIRKKYPSFSYMPGIDPYWAASNLKEAYEAWYLLKIMAEAAEPLRGDNKAPKEAYGILKAGLAEIAPTSTRISTITDYDALTPEAEDARCPVDLDGTGKLTTITGGIAPGNLWYVAARLGVGKSWRLLAMAVAAAEAGWNVKFYSLEMSKAEVIDRIHSIALRHEWKRPWSEITRSERIELMDAWAQRSGNILVADPTAGPIDASVIAGNHEDGDLAIVDYIGLMRSTTGTRAIEDWRAAATISNQLKEVALEHSIPLISAAQINREGGKATGGPRAEHLAQSDALGQDADLLLMVTEYSRRVHLNTISKNRHGIHGTRWYSRFEPSLAAFEHLTSDQAEALKAADDAADEAGF